jgi:hypothetical protein
MAVDKRDVRVAMCSNKYALVLIDGHDLKQ